MLDKVSMINALPLRYRAQIGSAPGVADVTHANWFGGVYQDPRNDFAKFAVEPESWLRVHPEFVAPRGPEAGMARRSDGRDGRRRDGAAVRLEARRSRAAAGDHLPSPRRPSLGVHDRCDLRSRRARGPHPVLLPPGLPERDAPARRLRARRGHLLRRQGGRPAGVGQVASRLDALFAGSSPQTKTATEKAFVSSFANQVGDIGAIMLAIAGAVLFAILMVTGNTMAEATRERTSELAVLKTLGFGDARIFALVLAESCLIALTGGGLGLVLARAGIAFVGDPTSGMLPPIHLPAREMPRLRAHRGARRDGRAAARTPGAAAAHRGRAAGDADAGPDPGPRRPEPALDPRSGSAPPRSRSSASSAWSSSSSPCCQSPKACAAWKRPATRTSRSCCVPAATRR